MNQLDWWLWFLLWGIGPWIICIKFRKRWNVVLCSIWSLFWCTSNFFVLYLLWDEKAREDQIQTIAEYIQPEQFNSAIQTLGAEQTMMALSAIADAGANQPANWGNHNWKLTPLALSLIDSGAAPFFYTHTILIAQVEKDTASVPFYSSWIDQLDSLSRNLPKQIAPAYSIEVRWPADQAEVWRVLLRQSNSLEWVDLTYQCSELNAAGLCIRGPRGSSIAWALRHLACGNDSGRILSRQRYLQFHSDYFASIGPWLGVRETTTSPQPEDMDSGPIIGPWGAAATAQGLIVAAQQGDWLSFYRIRYTLWLGETISHFHPELRAASNSFLANALKFQADEYWRSAQW